MDCLALENVIGKGLNFPQFTNRCRRKASWAPYPQKITSCTSAATAWAPELAMCQAIALPRVKTLDTVRGIRHRRRMVGHHAAASQLACNSSRMQISELAWQQP